MSGTIAVGATDVTCTPTDDGRVALHAGARRFTLAMRPAQADRLRGVLTDIVPRLERSAPIAAQLGAADTERLRPYVPQLLKLGVLLTPAPGTAPIASASDRQLYLFIARRTPEPGPVYDAVKRRRVDLRGPADLTAPTAQALRDQGIVVGDVAVDPAAVPTAETGLTVAFAVGEPAVLRDVNKRRCDAGAPWVPVLVGQRTVRIGPWTSPGESACLGCLPENPGAPDTPDAPPQAAASWLTRQPGFVRWMAGLISHLTLRTFVPMAGFHPWGRASVLDSVTADQTSVRYWRNPYCPDCAAAAAVSDVWVQA